MTTSLRTTRRSAAPIGRPAVRSDVRSAAAVILLLAGALAASWVAVFDARLAWAVAAIGAIAIGVVATGTRARWIALSLIPASLLTESAIVPFDGRYIPVLMLAGALGVALRSRTGAAFEFARLLPRWFVVAIGAYLAWALVATLATISFGELEYVAGIVVTLGAAFVATPMLLTSDLGLKRVFMIISVSGAALLIFGLVLAAGGGITLLGRAVGVYFITEIVVFGMPTGIVFPQNYGPFLGPATEYLAFAIATSAYLGATAEGRRRWLLWAIALFCVVGLVSTFSREGILMAALATGTIALGTYLRGQVLRGVIALSAVLVVILAVTISGAVTVLGRMDLVRAWYGPDAVATLLNPVIADRGVVQHVPSPGGSPATGGGGAGGADGGSGGGGDSGVEVPVVPDLPDVVELKTTSSFEARLALWHAAYVASMKAPVFGHGLGSNADAVVPFLQGSDARLRGASVHSTVMRMLVELGIPGLLSYLAVMAGAVWLVLRAIWRTPREAALPLAGIVIASLAHQLFGTLLLGGLTYGSYSFAVALGLLAWIVANPTRRSVESRRPALG